MKKVLYLIYTVLVVAVLAGKVAGWVVHFDEGINKALNTAMFSLIGVAYIVMGFAWVNRQWQFLFFTCGAMLIIINFLQPGAVINIIGIVSIVVPLLVARFNKEKHKEVV
jgi:membrane-bound ClpP family serine protease